MPISMKSRPKLGVKPPRQRGKVLEKSEKKNKRSSRCVIYSRTSTNTNADSVATLVLTCRAFSPSTMHLCIAECFCDDVHVSCLCCVLFDVLFLRPARLARYRGHAPVPERLETPLSRLFLRLSVETFLRNEGIPSSNFSRMGSSGRSTWRAAVQWRDRPQLLSNCFKHLLSMESKLCLQTCLNCISMMLLRSKNASAGLYLRPQSWIETSLCNVSRTASRGNCKPPARGHRQGRQRSLDAQRCLRLQNRRPGSWPS